jgi:hypothetical protein
MTLAIVRASNVIAAPQQVGQVRTAGRHLATQ